MPTAVSRLPGSANKHSTEGRNLPRAGSFSAERSHDWTALFLSGPVPQGKFDPVANANLIVDGSQIVPDNKYADPEDSPMHRSGGTVRQLLVHNRVEFFLTRRGQTAVPTDPPALPDQVTRRAREIAQGRLVSSCPSETVPP